MSGTSVSGRSSGHQSLLVWLSVNMSQYLETSFWNDDDDHESDDEGIGSDNSVDHQSDSPCNCPGDTGDNVVKTPVKQSLSVTKFLRVLKASVRRDPRQVISGDQLCSGAVFGVDLSQHLASPGHTAGDNVPEVVR